MPRKGKGLKLRNICKGEGCPRQGTRVTMERYATPKGWVYRCPECKTLTNK